MQLKSLATAIAIAASFAGAPALAASADASAAITGFSIELIDLDLTDGITPSITLDQQGFSVIGRSSDPFRYQSLDAAGSVDVTQPYGAGRASAGLTEFASRAFFTAASPDNISFSAQTSRAAEFTLSPNTGLRLSGLGTLSVQQDQADQASANLVLHLSLRDWSNGVSSESWVTESYSSTNGTRAHALSVYLASGKQAQEGYFTVNTSTEVDLITTPPPVPEPATYGMLLAGAAIIGATARKRRRA